MKKILATILTIAMLMTTLSVGVIPAQAENIASDNYVFNEDFENYGTADWISGIDANGYVTGVDNMKAQSWTIYGKSDFNTDAGKPSITVVEYPAGSGNKALEVNSGNMPASSWFRLRRNAVDSNSGMKRADLTGKVLVIKADIWTPSGYTTAADTAVFGYDPYAKTNSMYFKGIGRTGGNTSWYLQGVGGSIWGSAAHGRTRYSFSTSKVNTVRFVHNMTGYHEDGHEADTMRAFADDTILTVGLGNEATEANFAKQQYVNEKFPQPAATYAELVADGKAVGKVIDAWGGYQAFTSSAADSYLDFGDFYGASLSISQGSSKTNQVMHMDNLVAYYVDEFKQVGDITYGKTDANGGWYKGGIEIPFNNAIRTATLKEIYTYKGGTENNKYELPDLIDIINVATGEKLEGAVVATADAGKTLVITPPKGLKAGVTYKIVASPLFMDVEGQGLNIYSKETELTTFKTGTDPDSDTIYKFDFEDYDIDGKDWIDNVDSSRYVTSSNVEIGTITINKSSAAHENHNITVVNDPTGADNKVLALKAGYEGAVNNVTKIRFNADGQKGISRSDMGKGRKLVYKAKIYIPEGMSMTESSQLVNATAENNSSANQVSGFGATMSGGFYPATTGAWGSPMARSWAYTSKSNYGTHAIGNQWVEWKHVADVSKPLSATHSDTVRAYVNDKLVAAEFVKSSPESVTNRVFGYNDKYDHNINIGDYIIDYLPAKNDLFVNSDYASIGDTWWGSSFTINQQSDTTKGDTFYIDDIEAFWIDALTYNVENTDNYLEGEIKINFNQKIRENLDYFVGDMVANNARAISFEELFTIVDPKTKEEIPGVIESLTLSEDGKTVSFAIKEASIKGGDYQIRISEYLVDEYGQGLENNSMPTYVDLHINAAFTPFELVSLSEREIFGFTQGRNAEVTAVFSAELNDASITEGIVVTNKDTGVVVARNNGWTANFGTEAGSVNYNTVVFDFGSLPTANYEIIANENFLAASGAKFASEFKVTIKKANEKITLFEENFDDFEEGNWVDAKYAVTDGSLTNNTTYRAYTVNNHDWDIQTHWSTGTYSEDAEFNDFAGIVAVPENATAKMSGKVFKIESTRGSTYGNDYVAFRRNFDKLNGIDLGSEQYKGKKLVYEADIYADKVASDNSFFVPFAGKNNKLVRDYADWQMLFTGAALRSPGTYMVDFKNYGPIAMYAHVVPSDDIKKSPVNYKVVISMGDDVDTVAYYSNGKLVQRSEASQSVLKGHEWNNSARHEYFRNVATDGKSFSTNEVMYGIWGLACKSGSTIYMDNFSAYLVDEFVVEDVEGISDVFNTAKSAVTYTFSKPVNPDAAIANDTVVLVNEAGEVVAGGIATITLSDANYKMAVKLSETLPGLTSYSIKLTENLQDVDGLPISTKWKWYEYPIADYYEGTDNVYSVTDIAGTKTYDVYYTPATDSTPAMVALDAIGKNKAAVDTYVRDTDAMMMYADLTTSKATSVFADAGKATINGKTVSTTVTFTNPEVTPMSVWCVVGAYGDNNKMLGCVAVEVTEVAASSSTDAIPVSFTVNSSEIKSVRMFVWNNYVEMKPYQKV